MGDPGARRPGDDPRLPLERPIPTGRRPGEDAIGGAAEVGCHYMLSIDNLLDLTHEIYIHRSTLAADSITESPMKTTRTDSSVSIERWMIGADPGVLWSKAHLGRCAARAEARRPLADRPLLPALAHAARCRRRAGRHRRPRRRPRPGRGGADRDHAHPDRRDALGLLLDVPQQLHPRSGDGATGCATAISGAYVEDFAALEAQQKSMNLRADAWKIDVNADAGQLAARKLHDRLIAEEQAKRQPRRPERVARLTLTVNGALREIEADPATPLIYVLRNRLGLMGAKLGCGLEQCGACAVIADGEKVLSCVRAVSEFEGSRDRHASKDSPMTANSTRCSAPFSTTERRAVRLLHRAA